MVILMIDHNKYYYKGYDVSNKNRLEKIAMELCNPYGYNLGHNTRREVEVNGLEYRTNQDIVRTKEFNEQDN